jgi:isopenicillin-N N-acyltransferase-like protein
MAGSGLSEAAVVELAEAYLPLIAEFERSYIEEMRGLAEGADVPIAHIVLLNARTELLKLAGNEALRAGLLAERGADGCTTLIVQPERTPDGVLIHGHNWDWKASCAETCVVLRLRYDDGPDILTFTEAGGLARFGFNAAGIAITGNYLECERDYRKLGVPLALIRRKVLEQQLPAMAMKVAYTTIKSGSNNVALSHASTGIVHNLECAPDETFVVEPADGILVHANHWLSPIALGKFPEPGMVDSPDSLFRQQRVQRLAVEKTQLGLGEVVEILSDRAGTPYSVCCPPRPSAVTGETATVATIVMRPALGEMQVSMMPALGGRFSAYRIKAEAMADA